MVATLWLPLGRRPKVYPQDERDQLINELYDLRTLIPNARTMELSELRDQVQAVRHKTAARAAVESKLLLPTRSHSVEEVAGALREFVQWRRRRRGQRNPWPRGSKRRAGAITFSGSVGTD